MSRLQIRWWVTAMAACVMALCAQQVPAQGSPARLWAPRFRYMPVVTPETRTRLAVQPTRYNLTVDTPALLLERPGAPPLVAVRERARPIRNNGVYWTGRIGKTGSATFTRIGRGLVGRFAAPDGRRYRLQLPANSDYVLEEIDWRYFEVNHGAGPADAKDGPEIPDMTCSTDTGEVIDVLVVWTNESIPGGDMSTAELWTTTAEQETKDALTASGVENVTIRVVHIGQVPYSVASNGESGDVRNDLVQGNGNLMQVHQMRDDFGADVAVLVTKIPSDTFFSGVTAFTFQDSDVGNSKGLASKAFALVSPWSLTIQGGFFFAHELGHLMGAQHEGSSGDPFGHSREHVSPPSPACGPGLRTLGVSGCTTKCAPCVGICPIFGAWSNTIPHDTLVTNCNEPMGATGVEDNALTIQKTAKTVANIRCSKLMQ